jgi:hypothetical protein
VKGNADPGKRPKTPLLQEIDPRGGKTAGIFFAAEKIKCQQSN